jgi:hypothetical protein
MPAFGTDTTPGFSEQSKSNRWEKWYKPVSLFLMIVFGAVGLIFLLLPIQVLEFFNDCSRILGMEEAPVTSGGFYVILGVAYMYVVTCAAYLMHRNPHNVAPLLLLIHAKGASSILSALFFLFHHPYLVYITNAVVDGSLAAILFAFFLKRGRVVA